MSVSLTPAKPGSYRLRANVAGAADDAGETDVEVFVGGSGEAMWYARDPNTLRVKLDKTSYKPGDTATVLVQSPFPGAELHVAVVRHGVLWETTQRITGAAPTVRFRVTPQMLPNAVVEAFAVRRGAPPSKQLADGGNALARGPVSPPSASRSTGSTSPRPRPARRRSSRRARARPCACTWPTRNIARYRRKRR